MNIFNIISANQNVNITYTQHISIYKILMMLIMQDLWFNDKVFDFLKDNKVVS